MGTLEIVIGAVLLLISLVTIIICMMQEQKPQNATAALTGASNDSFLTVLFFVLILFIDIVMPLITK